MYYYKDPEIDLNEIVSSQLPRIPVDVTIKGIVLLSRGGGGYSVNFWVGMCRWDSETLTLY